MRPVVKKLLHDIEDVLINANQDSIDLWAILSALRGPDTGVEHTKGDTTIPIRRQAFPRIASLDGWWVASRIKASFKSFAINSTSGESSLIQPERVPEKLLTANVRMEDHFLRHIQRAQKACDRE